MKNSKLYKIKTISYLSLFTALICIGAFIKIPLAIPITLQLFFTNTAALALGKKGAISVLAYIFIGLIGFGVFNEGGGFASIFSLSFGFNIGLFFGALFAGAISKKRNCRHSFALASFINVLTVYFFGTVYYLLLQNLYFSTHTALNFALLVCVVPFVIPDIIKCALSIALSKRLQNLI